MFRKLFRPVHAQEEEIVDPQAVLKVSCSQLLINNFSALCFCSISCINHFDVRSHPVSHVWL